MYLVGKTFDNEAEITQKRRMTRHVVELMKMKNSIMKLILGIYAVYLPLTTSSLDCQLAAKFKDR